MNVKGIKFKGKKKPVILYIVILIALCIIVYGIPKLGELFEPTQRAEYGTLVDKDDMTFYIVKNEQVYVSGVTGTMNQKLSEGEKVKRTAIVANLSGGGDSDSEPAKKYSSELESLGDSAIVTDDCKTQLNGILTYSFDGYEKKLNLDNAYKFKYEDVKGVKNDSIDLSRKKVVRGEPIFKISDNKVWYLVSWVDNKSIASKYKEGQIVNIDLQNGQIRTTVAQVKAEDGKYKIMFSCNRYYENFAQIRVEDGSAETFEYTGILLDSKCITKYKGQTGVMVRTKTGDYNFVPVDILVDNGSQVILSEEFFYNDKGEKILTVKVYDVIKKNPK